MTKTRTYPACCLSASCGQTECDGCPSKHVLDEFKAWVSTHKARVADPIWSPTIYIASPLVEPPTRGPWGPSVFDRD